MLEGLDISVVGGKVLKALPGWQVNYDTATIDLILLHIKCKHRKHLRCGKSKRAW